jgi:hypothetical protein
MQSFPTVNSNSISPYALAWFRIAIMYLIIGITLGMIMGVTQKFGMRPVHAHLNLVGWATGAIAGLLYLIFPQAAESKLGKLHFLLHNIGVPIMMAALALVLSGKLSMLPALVLGECLTAAGVLTFAVNLFVNVKSVTAHGSTNHRIGDAAKYWNSHSDRHPASPRGGYVAH